MAQLLHGSATTTARTRAEFQSSDESAATTLARRYGVNPKTVAKWRKRDYVDERLPDGTARAQEHDPHAARRSRYHRLPGAETRLPLDDVFCALKPSIPTLARSTTLHRCLQRHGVWRLPRPARERRGRFKGYERLATFTWTSARFASSRARLTYSLRWTVLPSSLSPACIAGPLPSRRRRLS